MNRILAINGSYREDGITDKTLSVMARAAKTAGAEFEIVTLRNYPLEFCRNCRACTQLPGDTPGTCAQEDNLKALVDKIENADSLIFASPTNFGSVTAIFKRFMERLIVYAYWPWGVDIPKFRKEHLPRKKALLVSSCAAPGILGRFMFGTIKQLKDTAKTVGAETKGIIFTGLIANTPNQALPLSVVRKAQKEVAKLAK